jgi:glutathione peroxidase
MAFSVLLLIKFFFFFTPVKQDIPKSIYDFKVTALNGNTIDLSDYKGKKILLVNTPINADYSRQYAELEALYQKYKNNLVVIGFLAQDYAIPPGSHQDGNPAEKNYNVTFPLAAKTIINGENMAPIYKWLTGKQYNQLKDTRIKWDFQKYLINEKGELVAEFDPKIAVFPKTAFFIALTTLLSGREAYGHLPYY